jgi:hypothetical protein
MSPESQRCTLYEMIFKVPFLNAFKNGILEQDSENIDNDDEDEN